MTEPIFEEEKASNSQPKKTFLESNRSLIKGTLIMALILLLMIPAQFIHSLVQEREERQDEVIAEVSSKWGESQRVEGPYLYIPYYASGDSSKTRAMVLLPEQLAIKGTAIPEVRHRSIYDVFLYRADLTLSGYFDLGVLKSKNILAEQVYWNEARLLSSLSDIRGMESIATLKWNQQKLNMEISPVALHTGGTMLGARVEIQGMDAKAEFELSLNMKGSSYLHFVPLGKTTTVDLQSPWTMPAFDGAYLPNEPAVIDKDGFKAHWQILHISREYPQLWDADKPYVTANTSFGVKLVDPADGYSKTTRSTKYALLFIALTFSVFFLVEIFQKKQIHPFQYLLVGFALTVFYFLLLSFTEHFGFNLAYLVSALATVLLIAGYTWSVFRRVKIALGFTLALTALYFYIFIIIQLEDLSLLVGSLGLFFILTLIMFMTRKVDWYRIGNRE